MTLPRHRPSRGPSRQIRGADRGAHEPSGSGCSHITVPDCRQRHQQQTVTRELRSRPDLWNSILRRIVVLRRFRPVRTPRSVMRENTRTLNPLAPAALLVACLSATLPAQTCSGGASFANRRAQMGADYQAGSGTQSTTIAASLGARLGPFVSISGGRAHAENAPNDATQFSVTAAMSTPPLGELGTELCPFISLSPRRLASASYSGTCSLSGRQRTSRLTGGRRSRSGCAFRTRSAM
jgi:hypothetical protein